MSDVWNKNPAKWKSKTLAEKLEALRLWYCTGPCGQSASVMNTSATLNATIIEAKTELDRLRDIEQKAIALLRSLYLSPNYYDDETLETAFEELRDSIGISCTELRGEK